MPDIMGGAIMWGLICALFAAWLFSMVWAFSDARRRGKSGVLVAILVGFLAWPLGWIAWLVFRPVDDGSRRRFNLQDFRQQ
jgi:hypothetical protein